MVAQKRPERVSDLLAYSSLIVKASRDYEETPWLSYDQHYRRHAAAESPKHWGGILTAKCGSTSISADEAPTLASQQANTQKGGPCQTQQYPRADKKWSWGDTRFQPYTQLPSICKRWNRAPGGCRLPDCSFRHVCLEYHRELDCQQAKRRQNKSPLGRGPVKPKWDAAVLR